MAGEVCFVSVWYVLDWQASYVELGFGEFRSGLAGMVGDLRLAEFSHGLAGKVGSGQLSYVLAG